MLVDFKSHTDVSGALYGKAIWLINDNQRALQGNEYYLWAFRVLL